MEKIYTQKKLNQQNSMPRKSTLDFIKNYSKSLHVNKYNGMLVELIVN